MRTSFFKLQFITGLALCLFSVSVCGQTPITGVVTGQNNVPIPYATVEVLNTSRAAVADENGRFSMELPGGNYQLSAQAVGFAKRIQSIVIPAEGSMETISIEIVLKERSTTLDEIVVTAQKTEQNIIDAPLAVTLISAKKVEDTRTWDLSTLNGLVPNYQYQELGVAFQQVQSIRGIQVFSENPAVATYIDGVNQLDILANGFQLNDIERIEVLRGPQGTIFGRNAMGGVINIITKEPTNQASSFFEASVGNLGLQRYAIGVKAPVVKDKLFFGVNGLFQRKEGFQRVDTARNPAGIAAPRAIVPDMDINGERVGDQDSYYGNLYLKWLPSATFDATLNLKAQTDISDASSYFVAVDGEELARANPNTIFLSRIGNHERNVLNSALSLNYYTPNFTLSSITTYQQIGLSYEDIESGGIFHSIDGTRIGGMGDPQEVYSQEFRIRSNDTGGRLKYTGGVYAFLQDAFEPTTNLASELGPDSYAIFRNEGTNSGIAIFGQASYKLAHKLEITGGIRYDYEDREASFNGSDFDFNTGEITYDLRLDNGILTENKRDTTVSGDYNALSPKVSITYQLNPASTIYLGYMRGFRAGGINAQRLPGELDQTFDPEFSDNYELGFKTNLWRNRVYVAATAFYIQWDDLQFFNLVAPPFTFARENVGDATSWGIELEGSVLPFKNMQVDASFGFNETEYNDFSLTGVEVGGNRLSNAPRTTLYLAAQYNLPINDKISFRVRGELRNIGRYFTDIQNDLEQENYSLVSARAGFEFPQASIYFWGQNLDDERYIAFGAPDTTFNRSTRMSAPRTYGLTLTTRF